ncbi:MAG TPA: hypothetical protein VMH91_01315 [Candidatus Paceibacterota bacterium]|nr:hypothetical protein [Candidatus Paceibacterota bacterium]
MKGVLSPIAASTIVLLLAFAPLSASAVVHVSGYVNSHGTYVAPYVRSNPNGLKYDNYSYTPSQGLYNPSYGTKDTVWDTPTWITDPNYYSGLSEYLSTHGSSGSLAPGNYSATYPTNLSVPANATAYGSTWYCNNGYKTIYDSSYNKIGCTQVVAPANATVYGSDWYCNTGYKTQYDSSFNKVGCTKVVAPANASIYGSDWYCNTGYKTQYDSSFNKIGCVKVVAPPNATVYGSDWYCNAGYKTQYDNSFNKIGCIAN